MTRNIIAAKREPPRFMTSEEIEENERQYNKLSFRIQRWIVFIGIVVFFVFICWVL